MAMQGNPPLQNYGQPVPGSYYVGQWIFYGPPFTDWFWEGNGPVSYVGGPTGWTLVPKPPIPPGWVSPPTSPPGTGTPPPGTPQSPPPPPPGTGVPVETYPPPPPITGPDHGDDPPQSGCGPAMAVPRESGVNGGQGSDGGKYGGFGADDALGVPVVAAFHSLPLHNTATWIDTDNPNKYLVYDRHPYLHKDAQGRYDIVHPGRGDGVVVFAPSQIQDYHCYGDAVLRGSTWPSVISEATLLLFNGASASNSALTRLAFGLAYPTSTKPKLGWYFDYQPLAGSPVADTLSLFATDDEAVAISVAADYPTFDINADVRCRGKLTVDGLIDPTGLVLTEQAANPWTPAAGYGTLYVKNDAPSKLKFVDDTGAEFYIAMGSGLTGNEVTAASVLADNEVPKIDGASRAVQTSGLYVDDVTGGRLPIHTANNGAGDSNDLALDVGTATGTAGDVAIGNGTAEAVSIGRDGKNTRVNGTFTVDEAATLSSTLASGAHTITQATLGNVVRTHQSTATNDDPGTTDTHNRVTTSNATATTLHTITLDTGKSYIVSAKVIGVVTTADSGEVNDVGYTVGYHLRATLRNSGGTAIIVGQTSDAQEEAGMATCACVLDFTGATIRVRVTGPSNGASDTVMTWHLSELILSNPLGS